MELILGAQAEIVEYRLDHLLAARASSFRLQYDLAGDARIDDVSEANLDNIVNCAKTYLASPQGKAMFDAVVAALA